MKNLFLLVVLFLGAFDVFAESNQQDVQSLRQSEAFQKFMDTSKVKKILSYEKAELDGLEPDQVKYCKELNSADENNLFYGVLFKNGEGMGLIIFGAKNGTYDFKKCSDAQKIGDIDL